MEKKSQILVTYGTQKKLRDMLGVSQPTVRKALCGNDTEMAKKIRYMAKQLGGVEVKTNK